MSEQTANGRRFRLYEIVIAGLLAIIGIMLTIMFTVLFAADQRISSQVEKNTRILVEVQTTLNLIASGLDIQVKPKERAGPAVAPTPSEKLATKDP